MTPPFAALRAAHERFGCRPQQRARRSRDWLRRHAAIIAMLTTAMIAAYPTPASGDDLRVETRLDSALPRTASPAEESGNEIHLDINPPKIVAPLDDHLERGLLQTPSARLGEEGDLYAGSSFVYPYIRFGAAATLLPWLEGTFRITNVLNRPFGPASFSGTNTYYDRSVGFKIRLLDENENHPAIALGARDIGGTGLFSGEYLVTTRRWYNFDFTTGIGWGNVGARGVTKNPLAFFGPFKTRNNGTASGVVQTVPFSGPKIGLFGGVEWRTPIKGVSLIAELDGNDYRNEPFNIRPPVDSPVNFGIQWQPLEGVSIGSGFERGNTFMLRMAFGLNVNQELGAQKRDPNAAPIPKPVVRQPSEVPVDGMAAAGDPPRGPSGLLADTLQPIARDQHFRLLAAADNGAERQLVVAPLPGQQSDLMEAIGQVARRAAHIGPGPIDTVGVTVRDPAGAATEKRTLSLAELDRSVSLTGRTADALRAPATRIVSSDAAAMDRAATIVTVPLVFHDLAALNYRGEWLEIRDGEAVLAFSQNRERYLPAAIGPAARVLAARVPADVSVLTLVPVDQGAEQARVSLLRRDVEDLAAQRMSAEEAWSRTRLAAGGGGRDPSLAIENHDSYPDFRWALLPGFRQQTDSPNGFFLYEIYANLAGEVNITHGWSATGSFGADIYDTFNQIKQPSDSVLPHVRSDIASYLQQGRYGISRLQTDYIANLAPEWYGRASAGVLEEMFSGVDGEVLWRPYGKRYAVGLDVSGVVQRGFDERFDLRNYRTVTGHLSLYYELPVWDLQTHVSAGRYLARDWGGTIEIAKEFASGIRVGVFATFTNVPFNTFGEGAFDKGFFVTVPLDVFFRNPTRGVASAVYRPLTRDGGQMLAISKPLYDVTQGADPGRLSQQWPRIAQ